ncbi:MAG: hypothetical protein ACRENM_04230 [Candidatus Dormibacteraceae bacterium]
MNGILFATDHEWWCHNVSSPPSDVPATDATPSPAFKSVDVEGGSVRLASVAELQAAEAAAKALATQLESDSKGAAANYWSRSAEAGAILAARRADWPSGALTTALGQLDQIQAGVVADEAKIAAIEADGHHGLGGLVKRMGDAFARSRLASEETTLHRQLARCAAQLSVQAPRTTIPEADSIRQSANLLSVRFHDLDQQAKDSLAQAADLEGEVKRRQDSIRATGFDALLAAARVSVGQWPSVSSPALLRPGEKAYFESDAVLARHRTSTHYSGRSQGFSIPLGHTGIRYRVGSFSGHPVQQDVIADLDSGQVVITSQRVVYVGQQRSVSIDLAKLVSIQAYTDAVAVFHQGKEAPDLFKLHAPHQFVFWVNAASSAGR